MKQRSSTWRSTVVVVLAACFGAVHPSAQVQLKTQGPAARVYSAEDISQKLKTLQSGEEFCGFCAQVMADTKTKQAIPALENHFAQLSEPLDKMKAAQVLVNLEDPDSQYWKYLSSRATVAAESDAPEPAAYTAEGSVDLARTPTPDFERWREANHLAEEDAIRLVSVDYAAAISLIAMTNDARAIPILRKALMSRVYLVQMQASLGLAQFKDSDSVAKIVALCHSAPARVAHDIAGALVYFDDPEAQMTVDMYLPKNEAKIARDARASGRTALY